MSEAYPRALQGEVTKALFEKSIVEMELKSIRKLINKFKATEEQSNKRIEQLKSNLELITEEKNNQKAAFEIRLNTLIRAFVRRFDTLVDDFKNYKEITAKEVIGLEEVIKGKDKIIESKENMMQEYEMALRIPRLHYKHIEKLRFAEIMQQRDEIIGRIKRRYGIDPTKANAILKMPDSSLPPEQQIALIASGAQDPGMAPIDTAAAAKAVDIVGQKKIGNIDLSAPRMQGDFSVKSIMSLTTAESKFFSERGEHSLIMSPSTKFGLFKNRRSLAPDTSGRNPF